MTMEEENAGIGPARKYLHEESHCTEFRGINDGK